MDTNDAGAGPRPWWIAGVVVAMSLGATGAVVRWEMGDPERTQPVSLGAYDAATRHAPWLIGLYGTRGQQSEAVGDRAAALADYDRVLAALPGHPATALARARLLLDPRGPAPAAAIRAAARADLATAERGFRYQLETLSTIGAAAAPSPETERALQVIQALRRRLEAGPEDGGKPR